MFCFEFMNRMGVQIQRQLRRTSLVNCVRLSVFVQLTNSVTLLTDVYKKKEHNGRKFSHIKDNNWLQHFFHIKLRIVKFFFLET